jgi:hypothetical protein
MTTFQRACPPLQREAGRESTVSVLEGAAAERAGLRVSRGALAEGSSCTGGRLQTRRWWLTRNFSDHRSIRLVSRASLIEGKDSVADRCLGSNPR